MLFDPAGVDLRDIEEESQYHAGIHFVPRVAKEYCKQGRRTFIADAAHCEGTGPQSNCTTFKMLMYDANNYLLETFFAHSVSVECKEYWKTVFKAPQGF